MFRMMRIKRLITPKIHSKLLLYMTADTPYRPINVKGDANRKWQDYVYIQCEYKSTKQKIKHLLREENKVKENKIS